MANDRMIVTDLYLRHIPVAIAAVEPNYAKAYITHQWTTNAVTLLANRQAEQAGLADDGKDYCIIEYATLADYRKHKNWRTA